MIHYKIIPYFPEAHLFRVEIRVAEPFRAGQVLSMPAWIPGSYMIRDFAKHVVSLEARCGGHPLATEKRDKQTWRCASCEGELLVRYHVYAWDLSVRGAHLDTTHGYFNGTSVFLRVVGRDQEPCRVEILPPEGESYANWRLATTLPPVEAEHLGFGIFQAENYDELIDHPVEMGEFSHAVFQAAGVDHEIAVSGRQNADMDRLIAAGVDGLITDYPDRLRTVMAARKMPLPPSLRPASHD